jgi:hypothetical protein
MFGIRLRNETEVDREVDLEEFLGSSSQVVDEEPAPARGQAPSEPPPLELDARLDEGLEETFPASDPVAVSPEEFDTV